MPRTPPAVTRRGTAKRRSRSGGISDGEIARCLASDALHLVLMATEACNFRCTYCYEGFELGRMRPEVVAGVKRLLDRSAERLESLDLSWFGGEPLLARDVVEDVMVHAQNLAARLPRLRVRSDMTTNGYALTEPVFRRLLERGVEHFQISFDGSEPEHDRKRVRAGGGPSFRRIWGNLLAMRRVPDPFSVVVRLHVDRDNVDSARRFIGDLAADFVGDDRFTLFARPLSRLGGPNDGDLRILDVADRDAVLESLREDAVKLELPVLRPEAKTQICYAARANSYVIRADGRLNKCTVALEDPRNQVGRIHADGSLEVDGPNLQPWMRGVVARDSEALRCPMQGMADAGPAPPASIRFQIGARVARDELSASKPVSQGRR